MPKFSSVNSVQIYTKIKSKVSLKALVETNALAVVVIMKFLKNVVQKRGTGQNVSQVAKFIPKNILHEMTGNSLYRNY